MEFHFHTGYDYLYGKNVFHENKMIRSTTPCHRNELSKKFEIHYAKQWENISVSKLTDVEDKQLSDIITECILRNILCNSSYLSEWEVEVWAECRITIKK